MAERTRFGTSPLDQMADVGVIGRVALAQLKAPSLAGRFGWLVPSLVRAGEYAAIIAMVALWAPHALPAAFGLLCVAAYHHYDTVYRLRQIGRGPSAWVQVASLGAEGRVVAVAFVLLLVGADDVSGALAALALALAVVIVGESLASWGRWLSTRPVLSEDE